MVFSLPCFWGINARSARLKVEIPIKAPAILLTKTLENPPFNPHFRKPHLTPPFSKSPGSITVQKSFFATLHEFGLLLRCTCIAGWCLRHSRWFNLFFFSFLFPPHSFFLLPNNGLYNKFASSELSIWKNSCIFLFLPFLFVIFPGATKPWGYVTKTRIRNHFLLLLFLLFHHTRAQNKLWCRSTKKHTKVRGPLHHNLFCAVFFFFVRS